MMQRTVFVSYASADAGVGARYVEALRRLGLTIDYDDGVSASTNGDVWLSDAISVRLSECSALVVLLSPAAVSSHHVNQEIEAYRALAAADSSRILLPVRLAPCESPLLNTPDLYWIDATALPFDRVIQRIAGTLVRQQMAMTLGAGRSGAGRSGAGRSGAGRSGAARAAAGQPAFGTLDFPPLARRTVIRGAVLIGACVAAGVGVAWYEGFFTRPLLTYTGHHETITALAWSPDSHDVASASEDKTVQICDASSGARLLTYTGHAELVLCVAWSPDGRAIVSGGDGAQVWEAATGRHLLTYPGQASSQITAVAWSPDGRKIVSCANDSGDNVQIWDAASGQRLLGYAGGDTAGSYALAWSPDERKIATSRGTTVEVWDATNANRLLTYAGHPRSVTCLAWSPDGSKIVSCNAGYARDSITGVEAHVWDPNKGTHWLTYTGQSSNTIYAVAWSPAGSRIVTGALGGLDVWDASSGGRVFRATTSGEVRAVAWSPDGWMIASGNTDATVNVWRAP